MVINRDIFVDVFGEVVSAVQKSYDTIESLRPFYMYGHPLEVANRLNLKDKSAVQKFQKFPLIYLLTDIEQVHNEFKNILYAVNSLTVYIISPTDSNYTTPQRIESVFKPILYPIYKSLLREMKNSNIIANNALGVQHTHHDRYGWGNKTIYGSDGLIFNQYLDAIELTFTDIQIYRNPNQCQ